MKILFGSDISVKLGTRCIEYFAEQNAEKIFADVLPLFKEVDETVVNLECAITESENKIKKGGPNIKAPFGTAETLKKAGINYVGISNNHVYDFGRPGLIDTVRELEKNNIAYTGIGKNDVDARKDLIIERDGKKIAIIAVCEHEYSYALKDREGCREYDPYDTNDDIVEAKKNADFVVVMYHGGKEHCRYPSPRLLKACRSMVKHGADLVLCQHTHCIGCYEEYMGAHILYGQGNFVFVEGGDPDELWDYCLLVKAEFTDKVSVEFIPVKVNGDEGIMLCQGEDKERILSELFERSKSLEDGTWQDKWEEFCYSNVCSWYKFLPENLENRVAVMRECEAHNDVHKVLYKTHHYYNERYDENGNLIPREEQEKE